MKKIVINGCYGGFGFSKKAMKIVGSSWDGKRDDPKLIEAIEKLGKQADGYCAKLKIVEIPDDVEWQIEEYDGLEWVAEKHRTWN